MGFLYLVEEHHAIRLPPDGLSQLSALVVAHIARRCANQAAHAIFLLILTHVDTRHHLLVVEQVFGQCLGQLGLTHTRRTEEDKRGDRPLGVLKSGTAPAHGIAHGDDGLVLTDDAAVQLLLQVEQLLALALHHLRHGDARPAAHNLGDIVGGHLLAHQPVARLGVGQLGLHLLDVILEGLQPRVAYLGHPAVVALTLGTLGLELQVLHLLLVLLNLVHQRALALPLGTELGLLLAQLGYLLVQLGYLRLVALALDGLALYLQLGQLTADLVKLLRHAIALHSQLGGGLVHQVDGLVGQETLADVALGELHGGNTGIVLDTHLVVVLVALFQSTQDGDGTQLVGLIDHHRLEAPLQGLVLLEILLILVERGGTNRPQLAARQGRLQDVGGVHGALATAGSHQRVNLVDEEDDAPLALGHLLDDTLQTLLKLTFILRTCHERTHVEREQLLVLQVLGHIAPHDTLGQSLDDGGLTRARLTYQDRVVLGSPAQDLKQTAYLVVAADDGVKLAGTGIGHQVLRILVECLVVLVAALRLHAIALTKLADGRQHVFLVHAGVFHDAAGRRVDVEQRQQNGLHAHKLVAQPSGHVLGLHQHLVGIAREIGLAALHARQMLNLIVHQLLNMCAIHPQLLEDERRHVFSFLHDALQQMHGLYALLTGSLRGIHRLLDGLLRLDRKFV